MPQLRFSVCVLICCAVTHDLSSTAKSEEPLPQEMISLPVKVVDEDGQPVAGVKIIPWALRCSQGHGQWHEETLGKCPEFLTDANGRAAITYPYYTEPGEFIRTTEVTLSVDHREYVFISHANVMVPREEKEPHTITIHRGSILEIMPLVDGQPAKLDGIRAIWSDGRAWKKIPGSMTSADGLVEIPAMESGPGQVMLLRLAEGHATHFTSIIDVDLKSQKTARVNIELRSAATLRGTLDDTVPRPIKQGRVVLRTLQDKRVRPVVTWGAWAPVMEDGSFVIENWPSEEAIQLIALCDGYIAKPGSPPEVVDERQRQSTAFGRPHVFYPENFDEELVVAMEPLVECRVEVADEQGASLKGVNIVSCPNVGWWNGGSQIYCSPLYSFETYISTGDFEASQDFSIPEPWKATTDANGLAVLMLPQGQEDLYAGNDNYELPVNRGRRYVEVELIAGELNETLLVLQPKGQEFLGDWDKLAGVLFGCTGEECRRLLEDPGFRERITAVRLQFDEAKDMNDPNLLKNAFAEISAAFDEVGDQEEVTRWRRKADEQAAKLKAK